MIKIFVLLETGSTEQSAILGTLNCCLIFLNLSLKLMNVALRSLKRKIKIQQPTSVLYILFFSMLDVFHLRVPTLSSYKLLRICYFNGV